MIEYKKAFSLLSEVGGTPPLFAAQQAKEALKESISAVSESFCCKLRLENRRNTLSACRKSPRRVIARSAATWQSKEALNKSAAADSGSFVPTFRFENLEIHKVFLRFSNLNLEQNPSLTALADLFRASLIRKISYSPENIQEAKLFCEIATTPAGSRNDKTIVF